MRGLGAAFVAFVAAFAIGLLLPWAMADERVQDLTASSLRIVDDAGKARITLDVVDGVARVSMLDEEGQLGCQLMVSQTGSGIGVFEGGSLAVSLFQRREGPDGLRAPGGASLRGLITYGAGARKRILLTNSDETVDLALYGTARKDAGVRLGAGSTGAQIVAWSGGDIMLDRAGKQARMTVSNEGRSALLEILRDNEVTWSAAGD